MWGQFEFQLNANKLSPSFKKKNASRDFNFASYWLGMARVIATNHNEMPDYILHYVKICSTEQVEVVQ